MKMFFTKILQYFFLLFFLILSLYINAQVDTSSSYIDKFCIRLNWKALYLTPYFRGSNFVRRAEAVYSIHHRVKLGASIFWGWRFGKNFGEPIEGYSTHVRTKFSVTPIDYKPYSFDEWFEDRVINRGPGYALNFKYQGIGVFVEYQVDKNGIGQIFGQRIVHFNVLMGLSYLQGESAGKFLYTYKEPTYLVPIFSKYEYYFVYEKWKYQNISLDMMIRLSIEPKKKDRVLPGFSVYYVYAPDQVKSGIKNFGWLWDLKFILWKKRK